MAEIDLSLKEKSNGWIADVTVNEGGSASTHTVDVDNSYYQKLTNGDYSPEELVKASFNYLLEREPKEAILSSFNLKVIDRYFSKYEKDIGNYLGS